MNEMGDRFKTISIFPRTLSKILDIRKGPSGFAGAQVKGLEVPKEQKEN